MQAHEQNEKEESGSRFDPFRHRMSLQTPGISEATLPYPLKLTGNPAADALRKLARESIAKFRGVEGRHDTEAGHDHPAKDCHKLTVLWNSNVYVFAQSVLGNPEWFPFYWMGRPDAADIIMHSAVMLRTATYETLNETLRSVNQAGEVVAEILGDGKPSVETILAVAKAIGDTATGAFELARLNADDDALTGMVSYLCSMGLNPNLAGFPDAGFISPMHPDQVTKARLAARRIKNQLKRHACEVIAAVDAELSGSN